MSTCQGSLQAHLCWRCGLLSRAQFCCWQRPCQYQKVVGESERCERNRKKRIDMPSTPSILPDYMCSLFVDRPRGLNSSYRGFALSFAAMFSTATCETPTGKTGSTGHTCANLWPRCAREIRCKPMRTMFFFPVLLASIVWLSIS